MCTWEECAFCCFGWSAVQISIKYIWSNVPLKTYVSLLIFVWWSVHCWQWGFKVSPLLLYFCQFLLLWLLEFALYIKVLLCWMHIWLLYLLEINLFHCVVSFFVSCNSSYFKVYFVWYKYSYSSFLLIFICLEYLFPSVLVVFSFQLLNCVP